MNVMTNSGQGQHAHWIPVGFGGYAKEATCSLCGSLIVLNDWTRFDKIFVKISPCPVCGATMDEEV